jgi:alpha-tubulin suppressor-like RCC1 family protein
MSLTLAVGLRANKPKRNVGLISGSAENNSVAIDKNGRAWAWGRNRRGSLGNNSTTNRATPVSVLGAVKTFCKIETGVGFCVAIDKNGRAWGWGYNNFGQLGVNSTTNQLTPVSVLGAVKTFCEISGGLGQGHAIDKNGRLWGWGFNNLGQLGDNTTTAKCTPVSVAGAVKTFCQISSASQFTFAIDKNGRAWAWGFNGSGQLGDNTTTSRLTPVSVLGAVKTFCKISTGNGTNVIDKNGRAWGWGSNSAGQLGDNTKTQRLTPVSVAGAVKTFCQISSWGGSVVAIDKNGRAWAWGQNNTGQLGDNSTTSRLTPVSVAGAVKTFCHISSAQNYSLAIDKNGRAWGWGATYYGAIGDNIDSTGRATPVSVAGAVKTFCIISAGGGSVAIDKNGRAWAWGSNGSGQLGDNTTTGKCTPVSVLGGVKTFCHISNGGNHSLSIDKNGRAWGWGNNGYGRLGDNSITSRLTPVSVAGAVKTFCKISSADRHSLAIDKNGRAWGWGYNGAGRLGNNSTTSQRTPVSVLGAVKTFCQISGGQGHSVAIDKNGRAWAWGANGNGQLGDSSSLSRLTPVSVAGAVKTFCKISNTGRSSLAIDKNGRAWGWGYNNRGQLGDNTTTAKCTPVSVAGAVKTFCHISGGNENSVAIDKNGRAWGWGYNDDGQLGNNSTTSQRTPVSVLGAVKTFCQISCLGRYVLAIDKNGRAWGWGTNNLGAGGRSLGDASVSFHLTPVRVCII